MTTSLLREIDLDLKDFENHLRFERRVVDTTIHNYVTYVANFKQFIQKPLSELTREDVRTFIESLHKSGKRKASVSNYVIALRGYFNWLANLTEDKHHIAMSFYLSKIVKIKREQRMIVVPTQDDVKKLRKTLYAYRDACQFNRDSRLYRETVRDIAILELLITSGLRSNELRNLKLADIDLKNKMLSVRVGKGDKQRVSLFNEKAELALLQFLETADLSAEDYLFPFKQGNIINYIIKKWTTRANINKKLHAHSFRHFFITESHRQNVDIMSISDQVGHTSVNTTKGYIRFSVETLKDKFKNFSI
jgi:integrase/recombinase XerD